MSMFKRSEATQHAKGSQKGPKPRPEQYLELQDWRTGVPVSSFSSPADSPVGGHSRASSVGSDSSAVDFQ